MTVFLVAAALLAGMEAQQGAVDRRELAEYRLSIAMFQPFRDASRRIAVVTAQDPSFRTAPLFSQEIAQGGEVSAVAAALEMRLRDHPELSLALRGSRISPRDYAKFALSLVAARLAVGFLDAGILKAVPAGAATENVAFVRAQRAAVDDVLTELGIEIK